MLEQNPALVREITQAFAELQREQEAVKHNDASASSSSPSKKTKVKASDYFLISTYIAPYSIYIACLLLCGSGSPQQEAEFTEENRQTAAPLSTP